MADSSIKVLFLDRDGTINRDLGTYVATPEQFVLIDRAGEAIAMAKEAGFHIVIITNQAGIARGITSVEQVEAVHRYLNELLSRWGVSYDLCYYCPSHPDHPHPEYDRFLDCRKPGTGMVDRAIEEFRAMGLEVDRDRSYFIGDKVVDVECGHRSSLKTVLVRTGHGEEELCVRRGLRPDIVADDLYAAIAGHILA